MMKNKILTAISAIMVFVPWTIFPLRMNDWALQSPTAEIMIGCYMDFMVLSGIFFSPLLCQRKCEKQTDANLHGDQYCLCFCGHFPSWSDDLHIGRIKGGAV